MKILKKKKIKSEKQINQLFIEKHILSKIPVHPFIVQLHYSFQTKKRLFLILDFCSGGELF